jgi:hypothetical protein
MSERIQHVVLFNFPDGLTPAEEAEMYGHVRSWPDAIGGFTKLRIGPDMTGARTRGYQYLLFEEFVDRDAMEAYTPHPVHQVFATWVAERSCQVLAFDYVLDDSTVVLGE